MQAVAFSWPLAWVSDPLTGKMTAASNVQLSSDINLSFNGAMNIPPGLNQIREANTTSAVNALLSAGWVLITIEGRQSGRDGNLTYVLGWCREETPVEPNKPERTSGNLADNARR